jgi:hypothetical protein
MMLNLSRYFRLGTRWLFYGTAGLLGLWIAINFLAGAWTRFAHGPRYTPHLPEMLATSATLYAADAPGGFLEGCVLEVYELSPETAAAIEQRGLEFFTQMAQPPDTVSRFGPWSRTPIPEEPYVYAIGALNGCQNDLSAQEAMGGGINYLSPDNYYSITSNREGILMVIPSRKLVVYGYFG